VEQARHVYEQGVRDVPHSPVIHEHLGDLEMYLQRYQVAEAAYERSAALQPNNSEVLRKLAAVIRPCLQIRAR
jgi:cytochrome c-type biogenesis protein CcmH/NrfG